VASTPPDRPGGAFEVGETGAEFRGALLELIAHEDVNLTRGWHACEFCDAEPGIEVPCASARHGRVYLGHAEVHVLGADEVVHAAPTMVLHYVDAHGYGHRSSSWPLCSTRRPRVSRGALRPHRT
jgi:hypothetical protein